jgi:hypothetical protein
VGNPADEARKATTGALTADSRGLVVAPPVNPGLGEDGSSYIMVSLMISVAMFFTAASTKLGKMQDINIV